jgi:hypothetical protein
MKNKAIKFDKGKYANVSVKYVCNVDPDYCEWVYNNQKFSKIIRNEIKINLGF